MTEEIKDEIKAKASNYLLPGSILAAALIISGSIIYLVKSQSGSREAQNTPPTSEEQLAIVNPKTENLTVSEKDNILGDPKAPVTIIEYADYQCPFCGKFFKEIEEPLRDGYVKAGKVKFIFRNFQFLGPESTAAAEAALCAKDENRFWDYHTAIYETEIKDGRENNGNLTRDLFLKIAQDLRLDTAVFANCFDSRKYSDRVKQDIAGAQALGVNSTPTSFINGEKLLGALPFPEFMGAIDNVLKSR